MTKIGTEGREHYGAVVLGAGITGLVSTAILLDQGIERVLALDEYASAGGNHLDWSIDQYTYDVGSFIFQDDSPLLRWFPDLMRSYVPIAPSWSRLNPQGVVTDYPFSIRDDLLHSGPFEMVRILLSVAGARLRRKPLKNAQDFAEFWLGPRLVRRSGLLKYMERFCGIPAVRIDLEFAEARMGWISQYARIGTHIHRLADGFRRRTDDTVRTPNRQLARPRGGFAELYEPVVAELESQGAQFRFGERPLSIERDGAGFVVRSARGSVTTDRVISTIPIDHALRLTGLAVDPLPTVTLLSLFYSFAGERGFSTSILYNFSADAAWKRLTVYSDFYGTEGGRAYFAVEVIQGAAGITIELAAAEFRAHTAANGLLNGDLRLEGGHVLHHAYPIYTDGSGARAAHGIRALSDFGLESFGRQGGFQYQPTARVATQVAETALGVPRQEIAPQPSLPPR